MLEVKMQSIVNHLPQQHYLIIHLQEKSSKTGGDGTERDIRHRCARLEARWAGAGARGCSSGAVGSGHARVATGGNEVGARQARGVGAVDDDGAVTKKGARAGGSRGVKFKESGNKSVGAPVEGQEKM